MKTYFFSILTLLIGFSTISFAQEGKNLDPQDFYTATKNNKHIQLIDVRTPGEFNEVHLIDAQNIDVTDNKFIEEASTLDKTLPTYVYCRSGGRSARAMNQLLENGFTQVYNLTGGINAWTAAQLPTSATHTNDMPTALSMDQFKELVSGDKTVLVDFTATWCGPCKLLKPLVVELANDNKENLKVIYIDVDKNKDLANELSIHSIPLLHVYKNGKFKRESTGLISSDELEKLIR